MRTLVPCSRDRQLEDRPRAHTAPQLHSPAQSRGLTRYIDLPAGAQLWAALRSGTPSPSHGPHTPAPEGQPTARIPRNRSAYHTAQLTRTGRHAACRGRTQGRRRPPRTAVPRVRPPPRKEGVRRGTSWSSGARRSALAPHAAVHKQLSPGTSRRRVRRSDCATSARCSMSA